MAQKKQLGQILLEAGAIDEFQLKSALGYQKQWGGRLGKVLVENRFITEDALVQAIHSQTGIPLVDLSREDIPDHIVKLVPMELAENLSLVPLRMEGETGKPGETLVLAMSDPTNLNAQDEIQFRVGKKIKALLATEGSISMAIRQYYHGEKTNESQQNVFQMEPNNIQFGGSEISMNEMVVVKGRLESSPAQPPSTAAAPPAPAQAQASGVAVEFEDPFAELDSLVKGPETAESASKSFDSSPPNATASEPGVSQVAPASAPAAEEDDLQEVEIVEELPAWEDEQTDESNIGDQAAAPVAVTPLEDLASKPPAAAVKPLEPPVSAKPVAPEPGLDPSAPASEAATDVADLSAFGASGDLLGSMDDKPEEDEASADKKPARPAPAVPPQEKTEETAGGIADREETIRLRTIPRPQPVPKPAPKPPEGEPLEEPAPSPIGDVRDETDGEVDSDQEDTITLRRVPRPESGAFDNTGTDADRPRADQGKPAKAEKPSSMEALLSRVGIGSKSASSLIADEPDGSEDAEPVHPRPREKKSQEFEDLLGEELVEEVQTLLESIESGEIDEEPPQIAKASHLIATVIRLLLRKDVFSEVELLEELKRR